jgi:NAD(P)H-flavin reductase
MFRILEKREVAPNVHEIVFDAPEIARKARPGQFCILMVDEASERVPYTLSDWDPAAGTVTLVTLETGLSSRKLIGLNAGDAVSHLVGPLGEPLPIKKVGTVALAAGCYGIGAILSLARALKEAGNRVISIVEARSHYLHYYRDRLEAASDELIQTTIDGSEGVRGHAVGVIRRRLNDGEPLDLVVAIGCPFMMMIIGRQTAEYAVPTMVALNPIMVDGTGMCGACRVSIGGEMKFACVDGPFFDAHQVDWEELWNRRHAYRGEEVSAVARTAPFPGTVSSGGGICH